MSLTLVHNARRLAIRYVSSAIRHLNTPFVENGHEYYSVALRTHFAFRHDSESIRQDMIVDYQEILLCLNSANQFFYEPTATSCQPRLQPNGERRADVLGYAVNDSNAAAQSGVSSGIGIYTCGLFTEVSVEAGALNLIHESAHMIGYIRNGSHAPYRGQGVLRSTHSGQSAYSLGSHQPSTATVEERLENPDAYAYFAAHVYNRRDLNNVTEESHERFLRERRRRARERRRIAAERQEERNRRALGSIIQTYREMATMSW